MILEYHRPESIEAALELLGRAEPVTVPLGGGSALNRPSQAPVAVVDLQALNLNRIQRRGNLLDLGATATLQSLLEFGAPLPALAAAVRQEAAYNLRQVATVAGTLVSASGRSPFTTALLALDSSLVLLPGQEGVGLGDLLPLRAEKLRGRLIEQVSIPLNARLAYHQVARSPADRPIVCAAAASWPSGRVRVALGGFGPAPLLAFDGGEAGGAEVAARSAYAEAGDEWTSAEYRAEVAGILTARCLHEIQGIGDKG